MMTVTTKVRFTTTRAGRKRMRAGAGVATPALPARTPRIAKLMALAIKFDGMLRDGVVANQSELARLARVTQPRMTQILNLNHLAPAIQEELLFLSPIVQGKDQVHERMLRHIAARTSWREQRLLWRDYESSGDADGTASSTLLPSPRAVFSTI